MINPRKREWKKIFVMFRCSYDFIKVVDSGKWYYFVIMCYSLSEEFWMPLCEHSAYNVLLDHLWSLGIMWRPILLYTLALLSCIWLLRRAKNSYCYISFPPRIFMGLSHSPLCLCTSFTSHSCWSLVSLFTVFWLWLGLERGYYSHMVRLARSCCIVTFTISGGKFLTWDLFQTLQFLIS